MQFKQALLGIGTLLFLASCSSTNEAISSGPFQKRKYRSGWHVNLNTGQRHNALPLTERMEKRKWNAGRSDVENFPVLPTASAPMAAAEPAAAMVMHTPVSAGIDRPAADLSASIAGPAMVPQKSLVIASRVEVDETASVAPDGNDGAATNDRTNGMAIAGFVLSFFIPLLGIIFSAIALGQIRRRGGRGHGLAVAGLVISIATILLLLAIL